MAYLDIISLADAKNYLKIDDTLTEDDGNITRMIKASLSQIERITNHVLFARSKSYFVRNCDVNVYDFPINSLTTPTTATKVEYTIYTTYTVLLTTELSVVLNVGYASVSDVPQDLIEVAYEMIDIMYYNRDSKLSNLAKMTLDNYKRFII